MTNTKDTVRILVDWKCNLKCSYCCNEQQRFRKNIFPIASFNEIDWDQYKFVCISGGEPLLFLDRVAEVSRLSKGFNIIYSNGLLWTPSMPEMLANMGIKAANIGLHYPNTFDRIIEKVSAYNINNDLSVRFHVWDKYKEVILKRHPNVNFRFWTLDDCDRNNEDRFVLTNKKESV